MGNWWIPLKNFSSKIKLYNLIQPKYKNNLVDQDGIDDLFLTNHLFQIISLLMLPNQFYLLEKQLRLLEIQPSHMKKIASFPISLLHYIYNTCWNSHQDQYFIKLSSKILLILFATMLL